MMAEFIVKAKDRKYEGLDDNEKGWKGPFCFIQGADPQYGMIDDMSGKKPITWQAEIELTRKAIAAINRMKPKPKFFVVCGDLVHAMPDDNQKEEQEADFLKEFAKVDPSIPLVCVCGNHDIGNTPTRKSIQNFRNKFGDDYFGFWAGGVRCLVLNSQLYEDASKVQELKKEQDVWLEAELDAAKSSGCKHLLIFQHIPWFLNKPDEEDEYFNIDLDIRMPMLDKFIAAGVNTIFCGHYHRNAGGSYKGMEEVVTSAMGCPLSQSPAGFEMGKQPSGLRVVKVHEKSISHQFYGMDDIPCTVDL
ncbi:serine/threonine-protein phosphatase CPPED1-like [Lytechinus variegatus]|uniref:serine/threonine-protein phosphatase CPPED1-like n=1 Tax=Lytechinus variegatus TaxID=7654 RepID=UPI001BB1F69E|nr:serine/threonine-protein phosphatase CPPED1-like [Lytechinus variegatus]